MRLNGTMAVNAKDHLVIGGCDTVDLLREFGSPLHVMDETQIRQTCRAYHQAFIEGIPGGEVAYASKAFCCTAMIRIIAQEDLGLDVVSGGELYTAMAAGFDPARINFHGNNKTAEELRYALECKVGRIVVDNFTEIDMLADIAEGMGLRPKALLRVQPGVAAHTHAYVQTGQTDSKFGLSIAMGQATEAIDKMRRNAHMELMGVHCHIGSQIFEVETFSHTARVMANYMADVRDKLGFTMTELNLGGGFGIYYHEPDAAQAPAAYAQAISKALGDVFRLRSFPMPARISVEPGRAIIGSGDTTLYTVGTIKSIPGMRTYVAVDGGMTDNPRPALYQSSYELCLANRMSDQDTVLASIAGRCCESGDMLLWDMPMPMPVSGDILAIPCTGAYHYAMSSNYNRVPRPAIVLASDGAAHVVVKRETYEDVARNDLVPAHLL